MPAETSTRSKQSEHSLDAVLTPIHQAWLEETRRYLVPVLDSHADFWTRWAAVRYLADEFRGWYRREKALVDSMCPSLPTRQAEELQRAADLLARMRLEADRIGRRRGTSAQAAEAARDLLGQVERWCREIEASAASLRADSYPAAVAALLAHVEACESRPAPRGGA
jgi:hypothetical protein